MPHFEYKVVPAPAKAQKVKGVKTPEGRFAHTVESELNRMGEAGWEYLRAELLPNEERSGLKAAQTKWRTVLIFRRSVETEADALHARVLEPTLPDPLPMSAPIPLVADPLPDPETALQEPVEEETGDMDEDDTTVVPLLAREEDKSDR